jgi:hypothetical protein
VPDLFSPEVSTRELARRGMQQAADHADAVEEKWTDRAFALLKLYAEQEREFMTERLRVWAYEHGLPHAPDGRAWGAVTQRAVREQIIVRDRFELTQIPPAHATPRPVWRSRVFGGVIV